ncbi:MAG: hypothetical protein LBC87_04070 [Fibromonadaceae bacterium]|jgi:hypothetical protein|nr:hypothetical protein [Fibromonadaceae bacterium]
MLYSDVLLEAAKSAKVVEDDVDSLSIQEKNLYAGYMRNAISRFNNDPQVSIGTEKVIVSEWYHDGISPFARLVRGDSNNLEIFVEGPGGNTSVSKIKWNGVDGRSMQELPQRLISAIVRSSNKVAGYRIVNERSFFEQERQSGAICYAVEENQGIVRVWQTADLLLIFDRAILFPWETSPSESRNVATGKEYDPLEVQIMIPTSHIPYLICLVALELANGIKFEPDLIAQLKDQLASQEKELMRNNVRDRVKVAPSNSNLAANFWLGRGL